MPPTSPNNQDILSRTFECLRFPLAVAVVFYHFSPETFAPLNSQFPILSVEGILNLCHIILSKIAPLIAVPMFFIISGYYFFINFRDWGWNLYKTKLHKRVYTLLIPFILLNLAPWLITIAGSLCKSLFFTHSYDNVIQYISNLNINIFACADPNLTKGLIDWFGNPHIFNPGAPLNIPLWYIKDLMALSIISPLVFFFIKKLKTLSVGILGLCFLSKIWLYGPIFDVSACFFFTLGAYFSINKIDVINTATRYRWLSTLATIALLIASTITIKLPIGSHLAAFFIITCIFSTIYITASLVKKYDIHPNKELSLASFFIYVLHWMPLPYFMPLYTIKEFILRIIPGNSAIEGLICFFTAPILTILFCMLTLKIMQRLCPKFTKLVCGNR